MMKLAANTVIGVLALLPATVFAHSGAAEIGGLVAGLGHPFGGVDHLLAMLAVGFWSAQAGGSAKWGLPILFLAIMVIGGAIGLSSGLSSLALPIMESGIVVSVLVMGILVAGALKLPTGVSTALVATFALLHGVSHGAEIPVAVAAMTYSCGFVAATLFILIAGSYGNAALQRLSFANLHRLAGSTITLGGIYLALA